LTFTADDRGQVWIKMEKGPELEEEAMPMRQWLILDINGEAAGQTVLRHIYR